MTRTDTKYHSTSERFTTHDLRFTIYVSRFTVSDSARPPDSHSDLAMDLHSDSAKPPVTDSLLVLASLPVMDLLSVLASPPVTDLEKPLVTDSPSVPVKAWAPCNSQDIRHKTFCMLPNRHLALACIDCVPCGKPFRIQFFPGFR